MCNWSWAVASEWLGVVLALATTAAGPVEEPSGGVVLPGRVVARESGRPVVGAVVQVERKGGARPGSERLASDADGRFVVRVDPPGADGPPLLAVTIRHPDFIPLRGWSLPTADLIGAARRGEPGPFNAVRLDSGVEYTGVLLRPDGSPAAGQEIAFQNWGWSDSTRQENFAAEDKARTDAEGRFRARMWKTKALEISVTPDDLAPFRRYIGRAGAGDARPDDWLPGDLGRFVLEDGPRVSGRLIDREGRPIAGEGMMIRGRIDQGLVRRTTTGPDGSFAFAPVHSGSFTVMGDRQDAGAIDHDLAPLPPPSRAIGPVKVVARAGGRPAAVELREVESVAVTCRFVDSAGRPARGGPISLSGQMPGGGGGSGLFAVRRSDAVNQPEPEDPTTNLNWGVQGGPDAEGRVVFHAPKGLLDPTVQTFPPDAATSLKTRLHKGEPLKFWGGGRLGLELVADVCGVTLICYRAPTVVATVDVEGDPTPKGIGVSTSFIGPDGGSFGESFDYQAEGRYRSRSLMPDHDYKIYAEGRGVLWAQVAGLNLPEGGHAEVHLSLRKEPGPVKVGDLAPEVDVSGLDGKPFRLADYRGKFVLLDLWTYRRGPDEGDLPFLKVVRFRFGNDKRFALLGLSSGPRRADAEKLAAKEGIDWLRAVVIEDDEASPIPPAFGAKDRSNVLLIGPDGRILATGLHGTEIDAAVSNILER